MYDGVYRVKANALYLRAQPGRNAAALVLLKRGQAVVRMDQTNWGAGREWWYVFADTPGAGVFVGYVHSGFLERWDLDPSALSQSGFAAPGDTASPDDFDPPREPDADAPGMLDSWVDGWNPAVPAEKALYGQMQQSSLWSARFTRRRAHYGHALIAAGCEPVHNRQGQRALCGRFRRLDSPVCT